MLVTTTVLERLERLERQQRRWRNAACLGYALAALVLLGGPGVSQDDKPKVVIAQEFVMVDANGQTRGVLQMVEGSPSLALMGANGKPRATLRLMKSESPHLSFTDANGKLRASMGVLGDGSSDVMLRDAEGEVRAGMGVLKNGSPSLRLKGPGGKLLYSRP